MLFQVRNYMCFRMPSKKCKTGRNVESFRTLKTLDFSDNLFLKTKKTPFSIEKEFFYETQNYLFTIIIAEKIIVYHRTYNST